MVPSSRDPPGIADALVSPCQAGARQSRLPAAIIFEPEVVSPKSPELAVKSMNHPRLFSDDRPIELDRAFP